MTGRYTALLVTCALAGFGGGCGDDDEGNGDRPLTKAEYIKQGDGICRAANRELNREGEDYFEGLTSEAARDRIVEFSTQIAIPNVQGQIDDLRALQAPEGDEKTVTAIYDAADDAITELEQRPEQIIQEDLPAFREANRLAQEYGFKVCGE